MGTVQSVGAFVLEAFHSHTLTCLANLDFFAQMRDVMVEHPSELCNAALKVLAVRNAAPENVGQQTREFEAMYLDIDIRQQLKGDRRVSPLPSAEAPGCREEGGQIKRESLEGVLSLQASND